MSRTTSSHSNTHHSRLSQQSTTLTPSIQQAPLTTQTQVTTELAQELLHHLNTHDYRKFIPSCFISRNRANTRQRVSTYLSQHLNNLHSGITTPQELLNQTIKALKNSCNSNNTLKPQTPNLQTKETDYLNRLEQVITNHYREFVRKYGQNTQHLLQTTLQAAGPLFIPNTSEFSSVTLNPSTYLVLQPNLHAAIQQNSWHKVCFQLHFNYLQHQWKQHQIKHPNYSKAQHKYLTHPTTRAHSTIHGISGKQYQLLHSVTLTELQKLRNSLPKTAKTQNKQDLFYENNTQHYKLILGEGGNARVRLAREEKTNLLVAIKKCLDHKESLNEIHNNRILIDALLKNNEWENRRYFSLITDYAIREIDQLKTTKTYLFQNLSTYGDLSALLTKSLIPLRDNVPERFTELMLELCMKITHNLVLLHKLDLAHRDIKPDNFLIFQDSQKSQNSRNAALHIQLADWGTLCQKNHPQELTGTLAYAPPEMLFSNSTYQYFPQKHDCFSLGMTLWTLKHLYSPLPTNEPTLQLHLTSQPQPINQPFAFKTFVHIQTDQNIPICTGFSDELLSTLAPDHTLDHLIARLLATNPAQRPTAKETLEMLTQLNLRNQN